MTAGPPGVSGPADRPTVAASVFGKADSGEGVELYTLEVAGKIRVLITSLGGRVVSLEVPDRSGKLGDVVLGFDSLSSYQATNPYLGAIVGRYGNRIARGRFTLDGHEYNLATNNGENHLHGGIVGFDKRLWRARSISSKNAAAVELSYRSLDGEEGYPGNLEVTVRYTVTADSELRIDYTAQTDKPTVLNLTNHSYFNLAGTGTILKHEVTIFASRFTPIREGLIPTGEIRDVSGTPFDFRTPHRIGERIEAGDEQLRLAEGYDHNWVLDRSRGGLQAAARVSDASSGRVMDVLTTEPGLQLYSGNLIKGPIHGRGGQDYSVHSGFCMETQHFPDSPNEPAFPSTRLNPGRVFRSTTVYRFSVEKSGK